ncbi:SLC13 family permease [Clavibacter tessellarius]|uniref:SLC13 family permease n=1 Tax=Clavibacter tessellarius TaxID=31965 RepID=UPI00325596EC
MFVIATVFPINIGFLGFIGAFLVGAIAFGYDDKEILEVFPSSIVLTIIGVTYFFGMAKQNGTIDLMVSACIRAVRGKLYLIPWVFFLVAAFLTSLGTFSPAAVALIAPAAMSFAGRTRMSPLVMGIMTINGAHAGAFSPISVSGVLVRDIVEGNGLTLDPWQLFFSSFGINTLLSVLTVAAYAVTSRVKTLEYTATGSVMTIEDDAVDADHVPLTRVRMLTLALIAAILVIVLVGHQPISFVAIAAGVLLSFTDLKNTSRTIAGISWPTVLLVGGMVTYIAMLEEARHHRRPRRHGAAHRRPRGRGAGALLRDRRLLGLRLLHRAAGGDHPAVPAAAAARRAARGGGRRGALDRRHRGRRLALLHERRARAGERAGHRPERLLPAAAAQRGSRGRRRAAHLLGAAGGRAERLRLIRPHASPAARRERRVEHDRTDPHRRPRRPPGRLRSSRRLEIDPRRRGHRVPRPPRIPRGGGRGAPALRRRDGDARAHPLRRGRALGPAGAPPARDHGTGERRHRPAGGGPRRDPRVGRRDGRHLGRRRVSPGR